MTETYSLTPSESVTVRSHRPELLEVEATYGPGGSPPPAFHTRCGTRAPSRPG